MTDMSNREPLAGASGSPLGHARLQTIVWTSRKDQAAAFYGGTLGLPLMRESHEALVYRVGDSELRVSPVPSTEPSAHTVLGFEVGDVRKVVRALSDRGVRLERFAGFRHDADGIWTAPDGTEVVWFRDPDGNLLSAVRYGRK
jgi:catechol 2,3-dioxygenase-like lactoylglutathione lyase family enzyme